MSRRAALQILAIIAVPLGCWVLIALFRFVVVALLVLSNM